MVVVAVLRLLLLLPLHVELAAVGEVVLAEVVVVGVLALLALAVPVVVLLVLHLRQRVVLAA